MKSLQLVVSHGPRSSRTRRAPERVRVLVVELARPGKAALARHLPADRYEVFAATTVEHALGTASAASVEVAVLDVTGCGRDVGEAVREVRERLHDVPLLAVGLSCCNRCALDALRAGAEGYLSRRDVEGHLARAIDELRAGGAPMSPVVAHYVLDELRRQHVPASVAKSPLTPREIEVVDLLSSGARYEDVASALGMSLNTVRTHVRSIYDKLDVGSRTEAVLAAIERGLVRRP